MHDIIRRAAALAFCASLATAVDAAEAPTAQQLEAAIPGLKVQSIAPVSAVAGLYEVIDSQDQFLYVDAKLTVAFTGEMFDIATGQSLSDGSLARLHVVDFASLPLELAIKRVKGNGTRRMAVFADPDCPYCAKLEQSLGEIDDVTVYIFVYPLDNLHPLASQHANAIWCAPDRDAAWRGWLLDHKSPPTAPAACAAPLQRIAEIAATYRVRGTPTLVFDSGRTAYGSISSKVISTYLDEPRLAKATSHAKSTGGGSAGR